MMDDVKVSRSRRSSGRAAQQVLIAVDPEELRALASEVASLRKAIESVRMAPRPDWISVKEYADSIGRTTRMVRSWIRKGMIETRREGTMIMIRRR